MRQSLIFPVRFPAIKGIIGNWIYYQTIIPFNIVSEIIDNNHSIREYATLDDYLQRDLSKRSKRISQYLLREDTRFFNSVIVGVFGDNPNWFTFEFTPNVSPNIQLEDSVMQSVGFLELHGGEILFSIDGQHRIDGIKQALDENYDRFKFDELPIIIVAHSDDRLGKIRTRRLFSEINTKAVRVTGLDNLITNEDNPIDIIARKIYAELEYFNSEQYIALNKTANIEATSTKFTTIINLKEVNKILYKNTYRHKDFRPDDDILENLYEVSTSFWNNSIENINEYSNIFINETHHINDYRHPNGGSYLFRPIGIKFLVEAYKNWKAININIQQFWEIINTIPSDLNSNYWKDILWDNAKKVIKYKTSAKFLREYGKYLLGLEHDGAYLLAEYNKLNGVEANDVQLELPNSLA